MCFAHIRKGIRIASKCLVLADSIFILIIALHTPLRYTPDSFTVRWVIVPCISFSCLALDGSISEIFSYAAYAI